MKLLLAPLLFALTLSVINGFTSRHPSSRRGIIDVARDTPFGVVKPAEPIIGTGQHTTTQLATGVQDLDVIALVVGQENYGLALVAFGEGVYSFLQAPNFDNIKVLIPPAVAAVLLVAVSGPMITSGDAASVGTGLFIATAVSLGLGASYILRLLAPPSDTLVPKEVWNLWYSFQVHIWISYYDHESNSYPFFLCFIRIFFPKKVAALGLVIAVAGFFSFGQNLLVDGFVTLPSIDLPGLPMPPSDNGV
jgi:hypothetical protein